MFSLVDDLHRHRVGKDDRSGAQFTVQASGHCFMPFYSQLLRTLVNYCNLCEKNTCDDGKHCCVETRQRSSENRGRAFVHQPVRRHVEGRHLELDPFAFSWSPLSGKERRSDRVGMQRQ